MTPNQSIEEDQSGADERAKPILSHETLCSYMPPEFMFGDSLQPHHMRDIILAVRADAALASTQPAPTQPLCRDDGRCQYAIDHGAEGMGHYPTGKCCMPESSPSDPVAYMYISESRGCDLVRKPFGEDELALCPPDMTKTPLYATPQPFPAPAVQSGELPYVMVKGEPHHFLGAHISVDVSTGDHDAGHRIFATVEDLQEEGENEYVFLAVEQSRNFATPPTQAIAQTAPKLQECRHCGFMVALNQPPAQTAPGVAGEAINEGIEKAAKLIDKQISEFVLENGRMDRETGAMEYAHDGEIFVGQMSELAEDIRALKSAAPTAQPQVDMATCNHIFIAVPIGDRYAANAPAKAVCMHCGYEPQPQADAGKDAQTEYGWLVENGRDVPDLRYRTMDNSGITWTDDHNKALRFARRADAEMFAAEDEDAWRIVQHAWDTTANAGKESTNQPVLAKELTDQQIRGIAHDIKKKGLAYYDLAFARAIEAALLAAQPSAQADVAAVRDAALEEAAAELDAMHGRLRGGQHNHFKFAAARVLALKSAAPTAQPQADGVAK